MSTERNRGEPELAHARRRARLKEEQGDVTPGGNPAGVRVEYNTIATRARSARAPLSAEIAVLAFFPSHLAPFPLIRVADESSLGRAGRRAWQSTRFIHLSRGPPSERAERRAATVLPPPGRTGLTGETELPAESPVLSSPAIRTPERAFLYLLADPRGLIPGSAVTLTKS